MLMSGKLIMNDWWEKKV